MNFKKHKGWQKNYFLHYYCYLALSLYSQQISIALLPDYNQRRFFGTAMAFFTSMARTPKVYSKGLTGHKISLIDTFDTAMSF